MSRRLSIVLIAALSFTIAPNMAVAQSGAHRVVGASHGVVQDAHRAPIDFGAKKFVPTPPREMPAFRSVFDPPLDESPWQRAGAHRSVVNHHNKVGINFAPAPPASPCGTNTPFRLIAHDGVRAPCRLK